MQMLGSQRIRTTAYHPMSNGMIERFHRQIKGALKCRQQPDRWTEALPLILLGIRATFKEDLQCTTAEMVYGSSLRLPSEFFTPAPDNRLDPTDCVRKLKEVMADLRAPPVRVQHRTSYINRSLPTCTHVFVRRDAVKTPLQPPYDGPFKVLSRQDKYYTLEMRGKSDTISIDRLKPAYIEHAVELEPSSTAPTTPPPPPPPPAPLRKSPIRMSTQAAPITKPKVTRAGRRVHFPNKLNL